jgi:hypothetical protein
MRERLETAQDLRLEIGLSDLRGSTGAVRERSQLDLRQALSP